MLPKPIESLPEAILLEKIEIYKGYTVVCYSYNAGPNAIHPPQGILTRADRERALARIQVIVHDKDSGKPIVINDDDLYWSYNTAFCQAERIINGWNKYQQG